MVVSSRGSSPGSGCSGPAEPTLFVSSSGAEVLLSRKQRPTRTGGSRTWLTPGTFDLAAEVNGVLGTVAGSFEWISQSPAGRDGHAWQR